MGYPRLCLDCGQFTGRGYSRCVACRNRRLRRKYADRRVSRLARHTLVVRGSGVCAHCSRRFAACDLEVDHVIPLRYGGKDEMTNLHYLCTDCHAEKTARDRDGMDH